MNRYLKSLIITGFIYFLFFYFLSETFRFDFEKEKEKEKKQVLSLQDFYIEKPLKTPSIKQKPVKKKKLYPLESKTASTSKTVEKDSNTTSGSSKKLLSLQELGNFFVKPPSTAQKKLRNLYGNYYDALDKTQKEFLEENINTIGIITQNYLRYPVIAARHGIKGVSVVEFFLYPNGDISEVKLLDSSGYSILDENSVETIEEAYKDYPRPETKTRVRITVNYILG